MSRRAAIIYDSLFPRDTGGGERVYRAVAEELVRRGWIVDYLTRSGEPCPAPFQVREIWSGPIYDASGVRRPDAAVGFARAVFRDLRRRRGEYDLIIASALPVTTLLAARMAVGRGPFLVADWLEVWPARKWRAYSGRMAGTVAAGLQWLGARAASVHTVNSAFTASRLQSVGARAPLLEWGLVDLAGPPRAPRHAAQPPFVISVGRLIGDKRMDALPAALAKARARHPDLRVVIVGDGPEREVIRHAAVLSGVDREVELLGRVSDEELDDVLSSASALVSASAREGFGLTIAEAAARGVPAVAVVGADNAAAELIREGVNGALATDAGADSLASAIERVLDAGWGLRRATADWYAEAAVTSGLSASIDRLLGLLAVGRQPR